MARFAIAKEWVNEAVLVCIFLAVPRDLVRSMMYMRKTVVACQAMEVVEDVVPESL